MSLQRQILVATSFFIITATHADTLTLDKYSAQHVVEEYKTLRSECAKTSGDERKQCFAKLSATTNNYKQAKRFLDNAPNNTVSGKNSDMTNLADIQ